MKDKDNDFKFDFDEENDDDGFGSDSGSDDFGFGDSGGDDIDFGFGDSDSKGSNSNSNSNDSHVSNDYEPQFNTDNEDNIEVDKGGKKRFIVVAVIVIVVMLAVILIMNTIKKAVKKSNSTNTVVTVENEVAQQEEPAKTETKEVIEDKVVEMPSKVDTATSTVSNTVKVNEWKEFDGQEINASDSIESAFTVTEIRHYAKETKLNELELKTVLTGSIAGLTGTYEIEIPFSYGVKLNKGNVFSVKYSTAKINDCNIVTDISY